eukprot:2476404-Prymnesium_polylepis.1
MLSRYELRSAPASHFAGTTSWLKTRWGSWTQKTSTNLADHRGLTELATIADRCKLRHRSWDEAARACNADPSCDGITRDNGMECGIFDAACDGRPCESSLCLLRSGELASFNHRHAKVVANVVSDHSGSRQYDVRYESTPWPSPEQARWQPTALLAWFTCEGNINHFLVAARKLPPPRGATPACACGRCAGRDALPAVAERRHMARQKQEHEAAHGLRRGEQRRLAQPARSRPGLSQRAVCLLLHAALAAAHLLFCPPQRWCRGTLPRAGRTEAVDGRRPQGDVLYTRVRLSASAGAAVWRREPAAQLLPQLGGGERHLPRVGVRRARARGAYTAAAALDDAPPGQRGGRRPHASRAARRVQRDRRRFCGARRARPDEAGLRLQHDRRRPRPGDGVGPLPPRRRQRRARRAAGVQIPGLAVLLHVSDASDRHARRLPGAVPGQRTQGRQVGRRPPRRGRPGGGRPATRGRRAEGAMVIH